MTGKDNADSRLEARWVVQLMVEFHTICHDFRIDLKAPVFEITATTTRLGSWSPATRTIGISRELISNYPWNFTVQVLRHEMAHQLVTERWGGGKSHGENFGRACELIGVAPEFRGCTVVTGACLDNLATGSSPPPQGQRLVAKVEKLLALGSSSNLHEAQQALKKAGELIEKHQLGALLAANRQPYCSRIIALRSKRIATYRRHLGALLQEFFSVQVVFSWLYDPRDDQSYRTLELFGSPDNVEVGEYCFHFLENHLLLLWRQQNKMMGNGGRTLKNSFYLGVVRGFYQKLEQQKKSGLGQTHLPGDDRSQLVLAEEKRLAAFVAGRYPRLKKTAGRKTIVAASVYSTGIRRGHGLDFAAGIAGERTVQQLNWNRGGHDGKR
ncbi:SprT-like domain-containing protein [Desulforhopalus singaporensis]|uniref:SprT-like family protein n=1 Tax=Desulforhopalus singaporensis TaxID=91360 RepID=A0A1H0LD24_9BACT|nr:SprT-like domain-containing protein [Desulforhopalus singaporensis]SDO66149.1 Protein of unknown function [Desulforhopalus singaporensis]